MAHCIQQSPAGCAGGPLHPNKMQAGAVSAHLHFMLTIDHPPRSDRLLFRFRQPGVKLGIKILLRAVRRHKKAI